MLFAFNSYAKNYEAIKLAEFNNGKNEGELSLRSVNDLDQDDYTGNFLVMNDSGDIFIHEFDTQRISSYDMKTKKLSTVTNTDFLDYPYEKLRKVYDDGNMFFFDFERFEYFDKDGNKIFSVNMFNHQNIRNNVQVVNGYFDRDTDILFFIDPNKNLNCFMNPTADEVQNAKQYRNNAETKRLLSGNTGYDLKNLSLRREKFLGINGSAYNWDENVTIVNELNYATHNENEVTIIKSMDDIINIYFPAKDQSYLLTESVAIHPSGDIYFIQWDKKEKTHSLFYVENTWDPAWRKQWYKEHK